MRVCVISFKECWQDEAGHWLSYGGFPLQMSAVGSLFDEMTLLIVQGRPRDGGIRLPGYARVVPLRPPTGVDTRRKLSVLAHLPYYLRIIGSQVRQADAVHVPLPGDMPFLGMLVALVMRKRLIARYGSSWVTTSQTTLMNRLTRACMRKFAGGSNVMLATGASAAAPAERMHWIPVTAISRAEVLTVRPDLNRAINHPLRLAYVGRLSPEKGVAHLVEALALLRVESQHIERPPCLAIIGDGPQRDELRALVKKRHCEDLVRFTGQLNRAELAGQLLQTDLCVLPSLSESFCKARLDAMLYGVPVMTTEVGFGREIVGAAGERGWVVPSGDTTALAAALRRVVTEPVDWPALRRHCRAYVEGQTLESWAEQIGQICARQWNMSLVNGKLCI
jgi:glycosyltransferase involved in cell wall biosynthesis